MVCPLPPETMRDDNASLKAQVDALLTVSECMSYIALFHPFC